MPTMDGVNLQRIEIPTFEGNILNQQPYWDQFQVAIHEEPHFGDVEKLTYLWDALKGGPAMYAIQGLTQTAESYGEANKCLRDCFDFPSVTHHEQVRSILQAPIRKAKNRRELRKL